MARAKKSTTSKTSKKAKQEEQETAVEVAEEQLEAQEETEAVEQPAEEKPKRAKPKVEYIVLRNELDGQLIVDAAGIYSKGEAMEYIVANAGSDYELFWARASKDRFKKAVRTIEELVTT